MLFRCVLLALWHLTAVHSQVVQLPQESNAQPETRFGLKYLGYFLSLLSTSFIGYQGQPIQTPVENVTQPTAASPLFSALPSSIPTVSNGPPTPLPTPTPTTAFPDVLPGASPFPTAPPASIPSGIVTSFGTFPPPTARPTESAAALVTTGQTVCGCLPLSSCINQTRSGLSVRIVTTPPSGVTCPSGLVYCCSPNIRHLCGLQNVIPGVTPGSGQANLGEFPWSAIILTEGNDYVGGGALIDELHVLTAAHKVASYGNGFNLKIRLGEWNLSGTTEPVRHQEVQVRSITNHPNYDPATLRNDLSVITLASAVNTLTAPSPQINTVCLPAAAETFAGSRCWVAGWGKDQFNGAYQNIIKKVDVPIVAADVCQTRLRQTRLGSSFELDSNSFLCAGGEANKDACTGDGGNALACERNGQFYVVGITVGGVECGLANVPGLYANIINFLPWINNVISPIPGIDPRRRPQST